MKPDSAISTDVLSHELAHATEPEAPGVLPHIARFEGGEHMYLGDEGWDQATKKLIEELVESEISNIQDPDARARRATEVRQILKGRLSNRLHGSHHSRYGYGAGIGLAGDHFETVEEMLDNLGLRSDGVDVSNLVKMFEREQAGVNKKKPHIGENYDHAGHLRTYTNSKKYFALAKDNYDHFGLNNLRRYIEKHEEAVNLAQKGFDRRQAHGDGDLFTGLPNQPGGQLFEKAKFTNAFADHFLTDMFASGHIRTPRKEIEAYLQNIGYGKHVAAGATKYIHDYDNKHGIPVKNAKGDRWTAYGDKYLHADKDADRKDSYNITGQPGKTGKDVAVEATARSVYEVVATWATGSKGIQSHRDDGT